MRARLFMLAALAVLIPDFAAAKLDKDDKKWLDEVRPIILSDEEEILKKIKKKEDRLEFREIFWARRDPELVTPQNEFREAYAEARATATTEFARGETPGWKTDCGRTFILLGRPDSIEPAEDNSFSRWVYVDKPGRPFTGEATVAFNNDCRGNTALGPQLDKIAEAMIVNPSIDYRFDKKRRLVALAEMLPKDTPARSAIKQPRQDFPLAAEASFLKVTTGGTALVGLLRGEAAGLATSGKGETLAISVAASAIGEDGREAWTEQAMDVPVDADGRFLASFKMGLKPGKHELKVAAVDNGSGKASVASLPIEVPDFGRVQTGADGSIKPLISASVMVISRIEELKGNAPDDPADPFWAYRLGSEVQMIPILKSDLRRSDTVSFFYQVYDLQVDSTGKANGTARLQIMLEGKGLITGSPMTEMTTPTFGTEIGPVPLEPFPPGKYTARLEAEDKIAGETISYAVPFQVVETAEEPDASE